MKTISGLIQKFYPDRNLQLRESDISSLEIDSRKVKPGSIFFARRGTKDSGENYIRQALDKGAVLIISEIPSSDPTVPLIQVNDVPDALGLISAWFYNDAWKELKLTGITGTNGKTTTSFIIRQLMEYCGESCAVIGTTGVYFQNTMEPLVHTTPEAPVLHDYFNRFQNLGIWQVAMEVSSHSLQLKRVTGLRFATTIFTNLSHDHLDFHSTMDDYAEVKSRLFQMTDPNGFSIINRDDSRSHQMIQAATGSVLTYGLSEGVDLVGTVSDQSINGQSLTIRYKTEEQTVNYPLPGLFNVYNLLASVGCLLTRGYSLQDLKPGIESLKPVPGRFEIVSGTGKTAVGVVDYSHTPDSLEKILQSIRQVAKNGQKVITVFGCGGDRDRTKRPLMGRVAEKLSDQVIVTSDNPRTENPAEIIEEILQGFTETVPMKEPDRRKAIVLASGIASANDIILVAGKGHETYQEINGIRYPFDDREVLREVLK